MNTRMIMGASAIALGAAGILLTFAPEARLGAWGIQPTSAALLLGQIAGGLYFGFAVLNWMAKDSAIGGIYNRPILVANLSHFLYALCVLLFGRMLYTHPRPAR